MNILQNLAIQGSADFAGPLRKISSIASGQIGKGLEYIAFGCAFAALAYVAIAFTVGGNRMRQSAKSHLLWIIVGILIAASVGGIIKWLRNSIGSTGNDSGNKVFSTILPTMLKF